METIHSIGDFGWFSQKKTAPSYGSVFKALKAHYRYVKSKASAFWNDNFKALLSKGKEEIAKRWDSRIALKFWVAVPKDWDEGKALKRVVAFVSEQLNIPPKNISAYFHPHPRNPHVHLIIYPRNREGKKLRINRKELKEFHKAWDIYLQELGYRIKRYKDLDLNIPIWLLKKNPDLEEEYKEFLELRRELAKEISEFNAKVEEIKEAKKYEAKEISDKEIEEIHQKVEEQNRPKGFLGKLLKKIIGKAENEELTFKEKQKALVRLQLKALGFKPDDKIAIVLIKSGEKPEQKIVFARKIYDEDKLLNYLSYKNSKGYNVYFSIHKLKPTAKSRKKRDFCEKQNVIALDIDGDKLGVNGLELLKRIIKEENLPVPTLVVKTSAENYQAYWVLKEPIEAEKTERIVQAIAKKYGLDFVQDVSRVMRLAGFFNRKPNKGNFVSIVHKGNAVDYEPFKRFLPKPKPPQVAPKVEKKAEQINYIETAINSPKWSLEAYRGLVWAFLSYALEDYSPDGVSNSLVIKALNSIKDFLEAFQAGKFRVRSMSEFEYAIADRVNKSLESEVPPNKRYAIIRHLLTLSVDKIRPEKLKRSPKYPIITASKVVFGEYNPQKVGKAEYLTQQDKALMERIRKGYEDLGTTFVEEVEKEAQKMAEEYEKEITAKWKNKEKPLKVLEERPQKGKKMKENKPKLEENKDIFEEDIIKQKAKERADEIAQRFGNPLSGKRRRRRR